MTKKDFFILIIKIFGLYSVIISLFTGLPNNYMVALMGFDTFSFFWLAITIVIIVGLFIALIFKSDQVVRILKLDKGFDNDQIEIGNLNSTEIVKLGILIIGGLLFLENIPVFLNHSLFAFKGDVIGLEYSSKDKFNWAISGLNLLIGFLLFTNYSFIANTLKLDKTDSKK